MKRQFIKSLFGCLTTTVSGIFLFAQEPNLIQNNPLKSTPVSAVTATDAAIITVHNTATVYVKARVMRTFLNLFDDAAEVRWSVSNAHYLASFIKGDRLCRALFTKKGRLIYTIRTGTEKDLPPDAHKLIKSNYVDYTIGAVQELDENGIKAWVVNLEDPDNLIIARVTDGRLDELQHYKTHFKRR